MAIDLSELPLNWELAVARFERDVRDDFFPDPLRNRDLFAGAKRRSKPVLDVNEYEPEPAESWDVPKPNLTLRHSINITAVDRLVYQALVGHIVSVCGDLLLPCSYTFKLRGHDDREMFCKTVEQYNAFYEAVRGPLLRCPTSVVVALDIAQYFENISLDLLVRKLIALTGAKLGNPTRAVLDVLGECLKKWSPYKSCGLPQNMFPSSFLGNVYLHSLDERMVSLGYDYHRYMDDIRVVAPDEPTARQALRDIITHLRELELSVNGQKTKLVYPGTPEWSEFVEPRAEDFAEIEAIVARADVAELPACVETLNRMLTDVLAAGGRPQRRLKFSINRLTSLRRLRKCAVPEPDGVARTLCDMVISSPELTPEVCEYFLSGDPSDEKAALLIRLLTEEPRCIYGWQNYHFWLLATRLDVDDPRLLEKARAVVRHPRDTPELAGALIYMGNAGAIIEVLGAVGALEAHKDSVTIVKALAVAVQSVVDDEMPSLVTRLAVRSPTVAVLIDYLGRLDSPIYVIGPRRITVRRLADEMPDIISP